MKKYISVLVLTLALCLSLGVPALAAGGFHDVDQNAWYLKYLDTAVSSGLINGRGDGRFAPQDPVTREQLAALLFRFAGAQGFDTAPRADLSPYWDSLQVGPYAREAMAWAVEMGLLTGRTQTTLAPGGTATRAETAVLLERFALAFLAD